METLTGQTLLGRYYLRDLVGSGGMADVYMAWDQLRTTKMAVKVLRRDLGNNSKFFQQFAKEAEILRKLEHPNIVRLYEFDKDEDRAFIVMQWIEGQNLRQVINNSRHILPLEDVSRVLQPICAALHFAHENKVFHCDIKPANIMLDVKGEVLLTDFGVAHLADETGGGGTPTYMAPEQFTDDTIDARTDVYALGITLFEIFSGGKAPYQGVDSNSEGSTTKERIAWEHLNLQPPKLSTYNPQVSPAMEWVITTAMQKAPEKRFPTTLALRDAFEKARSTITEQTIYSPQDVMDGLSSLTRSVASAASNVIDMALPKPGQTDWLQHLSFPTQKSQGPEQPRPQPVQKPPSIPGLAGSGKGPFLYCRSGQWPGQKLAIPMGELVIGRGSQSQIKLNDGTISRRHATIIRTRRGVYIRDDASSLGTYVNGVRINGPTLLRDRDVIQIGHQQVFEFKGS